MTRNPMTILAGLAIAGAVGCAPPDVIRDATADLEAINAVREAEASTLTAGDIVGSLAVFTDDVAFMPPNEPALMGQQAVRTWFEAASEQFSIGLEYAPSSVALSGDWAIEPYSATATFTPKAGGEGMTEEIKGVHIYRRQADGSWKISHDIWNTNAPAPPM